jgi:hypothetical protein
VVAAATVALTPRAAPTLATSAGRPLQRGPAMQWTLTAWPLLLLVLVVVLLVPVASTWTTARVPRGWEGLAPPRQLLTLLLLLLAATTVCQTCLASAAAAAAAAAEEEATLAARS